MSQLIYHGISLIIGLLSSLSCGQLHESIKHVQAFKMTHFRTKGVVLGAHGKARGRLDRSCRFAYNAKHARNLAYCHMPALLSGRMWPRQAVFGPSLPYLSARLIGRTFWTASDYGKLLLQTNLRRPVQPALRTHT
jgi:hypothetical protein